MELEKAVTRLGCKRTMVWGDVKGRDLYERENWIIFEKATKLDVPIYLHVVGAIEGSMCDIEGGVMGGAASKAMGLIF